MPRHLSRLVSTIALTLLATPLSGCLLTGGDDNFDSAVNEEVDERQFDAECALVPGPVVLPGDRARVDALLDDADCARIDGNLTVRGDVESLGRIESLDALRVSGRVVVSTSGMEDLRKLSALTRIDGDFVVEQCDGLLSTEGLVRLRRVGGDFRVSANADLRLVHGEKRLHQIGADLIVEDNPVVCDMTGFDGLQYIADYDDPEDRPTGAGEFGGGDPTTRPGIVDPHLIVTDNPQLKRIEGFGGLTDIDGDIRLERNDELVTVRGFEQLEFMTGRLIVRDQPFLQKIDALVRPSCLREVVLENTALTDLGAFSEVWEIGRLELVDNDGLAGVNGLHEDLRLRGPVFIESNEALRTLAGLGHVESIDPGRDSDRDTPAIYRETANFRCVETGIRRDSPSDVTIHGNPALEELGLLALDMVFGSLVISENPGVVDLSGLPALREIQGDFEISSNANLREIAALDAVGFITGDLVIAANPSLERIGGFGELDLLRGSLKIEANPALDAVDGFTKLREVEELVVRDNGVTDLDGFAGLESADALSVQQNPRLARLTDFVALRKIDGELRVEDNAVLTTLEMPSLTNAEGVVIQNNPDLPTCDAEDLAADLWGMDYALIEDNAPCP